MLKVDTYSSKGTKLTATTLPKEWEAETNSALTSQAMRVYIERSHMGLRKTQTRSEVNRTTKKLYKQKGTGGARHGSRSAPIFVGGGVAHGPRPERRILTLPTQMKRKAIAVTVSKAVKEGRVFAGDLGFKKTNDVQNFINKVVGKNERVTFVVKKENIDAFKFMRNIKDVYVSVFPSINAFDIHFGGKIVFDKDIFRKEATKKVATKKTK